MKFLPFMPKSMLWITAVCVCDKQQQRETANHGLFVQCIVNNSEGDESWYSTHTVP